VYTTYTVFICWCIFIGALNIYTLYHMVSMNMNVSVLYFYERPICTVAEPYDFVHHCLLLKVLTVHNLVCLYPSCWMITNLWSKLMTVPSCNYWSISMLYSSTWTPAESVMQLYIMSFIHNVFIAKYYYLLSINAFEPGGIGIEICIFSFFYFYCLYPPVIYKRRKIYIFDVSSV